jgi:hypothetical protein
VFGKHVHPTGHLAPIIVLCGLGIPELVSGSGGVVVLLYSMIIVITINRISEITKSTMAPSSI